MACPPGHPGQRDWGPWYDLGLLQSERRLLFRQAGDRADPAVGPSPGHSGPGCSVCDHDSRTPSRSSRRRSGPDRRVRSARRPDGATATSSTAGAGSSEPPTGAGSCQPAAAGSRPSTSAATATATTLRVDAVEAVLSFDTFAAIGTLNRVVVEDESALPEAMAIVRAEIREIDEVCSRFREDSELSDLNRRAGDGDIAISPLLEEAILAAIHTSEMTGGRVDPTVGKCVEDVGYTVTFRDLPPDGPALRVRIHHVVGWRAIGYDSVVHTVRLPAGVALDLGASGKAWAADRCAAAVAARLGVSIAVECGGDIAVAGPLPEGGWPVRVAADSDSKAWQDVVIFDGGLATSGTTSRSWRRGGVELHHIIDPATGLPARSPWIAVSVAAASCLEANAAATAALIMGDQALGWLDELRLPARLVQGNGNVHYAGGWSAGSS